MHNATKNFKMEEKENGKELDSIGGPRGTQKQ